MPTGRTSGWVPPWRSASARHRARRADSVAAVIVYENRWVLSLVNTWRRSGARFIADGGISASDVVAALDATEPA